MVILVLKEKEPTIQEEGTWRGWGNPEPTKTLTYVSSRRSLRKNVDCEKMCLNVPQNPLF